MLRLLHRVYLRTWPLARWLRRRLTPAGVFVLGGGLVAGTSANPDETMGLQVFIVLATLLGLAALHAPFFRPRFVLEREAPRFATAGTPFQVRVRLRNLSQRAQRGVEYLEDLRERPLSLAEFTARLRPPRRGAAAAPPMARTRFQPLPPVPAGGLVEARVEIVAFRRGALMLGGGRVARSDAFGLVRALRRLPQPRTVLILPRRHPLPPLDLPGQTQYQRGGVAMAAGVGESEEFVALREYRRGDSLRRVHWRSTARLGELVVREYQDEYFVRHALVLDTFCESRRDALFEEAVAVAASFACTVPDQESLLDLMFVGPATVCLTSGRGVGHAEQMLEVLASVEPCRDNRLPELQSLLLQHAPGLSGCILVLLEWDAPRRDLVRQLKALGLPTLVLVLVPPGQRDSFDPGPAADRPDQLHLLEAGRVAEDLQQLGSIR